MFGVERFGYVRISPGLQGGNTVLNFGFGSQQDDRQVTGVEVFSHLAAQLNAIHLRHYHIRNNQVGLLRNHLVIGIPAVFSKNDVVILLKEVSKQDKNLWV